VANQIPQSARDLFERPILCALSTLNPDGQPHTVPVWCDLDGQTVRVNSPDATKKARNMKQGSKVTVLLIDPQNPFHWVEVQGHVVGIKDEAHGARDHINGLSKKYIGNPVYQDAPGMSKNRVMFIIQPDKVNGW
jgi:PPOX class probable F420-dependent enzyme